MNIYPFNYVYFLCLALCAIITIVISLIFSKKDEKVRKITILSCCAFNFLLFIVYKIVLATEPATLVSHGYQFIIWEELPLHLCNISLFLVPIGILINNKKLLAYGFYIAPLGAFMAVCSPSPEFIGESIFEFYNIGFYFTHLNIIIVGVLLVTLGFFKPSFKELLFLNIYAICIACGIFILNLCLRGLTGADVNYFYTVHDGGVSLLKVFWSIIPVPLLYLIFAIPILNVYCLLVTLPFHLYDRHKRKKELING